MAKVWVFAEVHNGKVDSTALEILTRARDLEGAEVEAVALGPGATDAAGPLGEHGAKTVYASDDEVYGDYVAQPATEALYELVQGHSPELVLFAANYDSRDIAGRLSAKTGSTLMSNVGAIQDLNTAQHAMFGGTTLVDVTLEGSPKLVLVRPKSFEATPSGGAAEIVPVEVTIGDELKKAKRLERHEEATTGPKL